MDDNKRYSPDGGDNLGNDMIGMLHKWQNDSNYHRGNSYLHDEVQECYPENRAKVGNRNNRKVISKKNTVKVKIPKRLIITSIAVVVTLGGLAYGHYKTSKHIADNVRESGILPNQIGMYNDNTMVEYPDEWNNRQSMGLDYFVNMVVEKADAKGFTRDEIAIACDYLGICDASMIDGSSLLGRVGHELVVGSQLLSDSSEHKAGRGV